MKTVIVVESPAKARKISGFFKDGTIVTSSFGHIIDLPKDKFYLISKTILNRLIKLCQEKVKLSIPLGIIIKVTVFYWLLTMTEKVTIAWHCGKTIVVDFNANRIIFHEISKRAIQQSIENVHYLNIIQ